MKMGRGIVRERRLNNGVAIAAIQDIMHAPVGRMQKCLIYLFPIILR